MATETSIENIQELLRHAADHFGVEFGILSHIVGDDYTILAQVSPEGALEVGQRFPFADTYCSITVAENRVVAISHMTESTYRGHPCYSVFKLQTYIGIPIRDGEHVIGTLNFSSPIPYHRSFGPEDDAYMQELARKIGSRQLR